VAILEGEAQDTPLRFFGGKNSLLSLSEVSMATMERYKIEFKFWSEKLNFILHKLGGEQYIGLSNNVDGMDDIDDVFAELDWARAEVYGILGKYTGYQKKDDVLYRLYMELGQVLCNSGVVVNAFDGMA